MIGGTYVSKAGAEHVRNYKYSGSDASLYYKYVVSPLAQCIVDHLFPPWLAPNTITVAGLSLIIISYLSMAWYCPDMHGEAPRWVYAFAAISLFTYQILDAADGKQARKTGNSSPLGLLFDHGCDALNVVFSAFIIASTINFGSTYLSLFILLSPATVFFFATWEEYFTGTLALPLINGPNEGLLIMYSIYASAAMFGSSFWLKESPLWGLQYNVLLLTSTVLGAIPTIGTNIANVMAAIRNKNGQIGTAALGLTPFIGLIALAALWVVLSPADIIRTHPRLVMWTFGLIFCKLAMHLMLAHLCDEPIWLLRKTLMILFSVAFLMVAGFVPRAQEGTVATGFFCLALCVYLHMVISVINELKQILGIFCFQVKAKKV